MELEKQNMNTNELIAVLKEEFMKPCPQPYDAYQKVVTYFESSKTSSPTDTVSLTLGYNLDDKYFELNFDFPRRLVFDGDIPFDENRFYDNLFEFYINEAERQHRYPLLDFDKQNFVANLDNPFLDIRS